MQVLKMPESIDIQTPRIYSVAPVTMRVVNARAKYPLSIELSTDSLMHIRNAMLAQIDFVDIHHTHASQRHGCVVAEGKGVCFSYVRDKFRAVFRKGNRKSHGYFATIDDAKKFVSTSEKPMVEQTPHKLRRTSVDGGSMNLSSE